MYMPTHLTAYEDRSLGAPIRLDMKLSPGQHFLGGPLDFLPKGFTGFTSSFVPSSAPAAPAESGGFMGGLASLVNLWNNRPEELKKIRIRIKPDAVMRQVQSVLPSSTVASATDRLRAMGIDPRYLYGGQEIPMTGNMVGGAYYGAGIDWQAWMPWILGGGAALLLLPALMRK